MAYTPKFCCECGAPVERTDWSLLTSRRFCQLCETDYKSVDLIPKIIVAAGILIGVLGLASFFHKAEKPLNLASSNFAANSTNTSKNPTNTQVSSGANVQSFAKLPGANPAAAQLPAKPPIALAKQDLKTEKAASQPNAAQEIIYFCGAQTKKGTPCTRHVRGGGRCWQHVGQPAMLPPEKLIASR